MRMQHLPCLVFCLCLISASGCLTFRGNLVALTEDEVILTIKKILPVGLYVIKDEARTKRCQRPCYLIVNPAIPVYSEWRDKQGDWHRDITGTGGIEIGISTVGDTRPGTIFDRGMPVLYHSGKTYIYWLESGIRDEKKWLEIKHQLTAIGTFAEGELWPDWKEEMRAALRNAVKQKRQRTLEWREL